MNDQNKQPDQETNSPNIYKKAVRGGVWLSMIRVLTQGISFVRLAILMRLLMPADFGLLGFASLTLAMLTSFTEMGFQEALIQKKENVQSFLNVAWTTRLIRGVFIYVVIFLIAPLAADFFDSDAPIEANDISNPKKLIAALDQRTNELSEYLYNNLSDSTLSLIQEYKTAEEMDERFLESVCEDLNKIASGDLIYTPAFFKDVELSKYVSGIVSNPDAIDNVFRVNKLLIQEAFPLEIRVTAINIPQFIAVIRVISIMVILGALNNIGLVFFSKELDFHKKFYFDTIRVFVSAIITITLAFMYRSVWALVFGRLIGNTIAVVMSYVMHSYRPRLDFDIRKFKELWSYGRHMFATQLMKFACLHGDDLLLAKMLGATALGFYQKAYDVGNLVAVEIGNKVAEVGFPAYAKLQDNHDKIRAGYLKSVQLVSLVVFPITAGLIGLAPELVKYIFGEKWLDMVPAMRILCLFGPFRCMQRAPVFMGIGRPDILKKLTFIRFVIIAVTVYPFTKYFGMAGTAASVFLPVVICEPLGFYYIQRTIGSTAMQVINRFVVPLIASVLMCTFLAFRNRMFESIGTPELVILVVVSAIIYLAVVLSSRYVSKQYDAIGLLKDIRKGI